MALVSRWSLRVPQKTPPEATPGQMGPELRETRLSGVCRHRLGESVDKLDCASNLIPGESRYREHIKSYPDTLVDARKSVNKLCTLDQRKMESEIDLERRRVSPESVAGSLELLFSVLRHSIWCRTRGSRSNPSSVLFMFLCCSAPPPQLLNCGQRRE